MLRLPRLRHRFRRSARQKAEVSGEDAASGRRGSSIRHEDDWRTPALKADKPARPNPPGQARGQDLPARTDKPAPAPKADKAALGQTEQGCPGKPDKPAAAKSGSPKADKPPRRPTKPESDKLSEPAKPAPAKRSISRCCQTGPQP